MGVGRGRGVALGVAVAVGVGLGVIVGVTDAVGVGVIGGVDPQGGVGPPWLGIGSHHIILTVSTRQPSPKTVLSLTILQRRIISGPHVTTGRLTVVVIKPPEFPVHA